MHLYTDLHIINRTNHDMCIMCGIMLWCCTFIYIQEFYVQADEYLVSKEQLRRIFKVLSNNLSMEEKDLMQSVDEKLFKIFQIPRPVSSSNKGVSMDIRLVKEEENSVVDILMVFTALVLSSKMTLHERLKWFFDAFDYGGDGSLSTEDLHISIKGVVIGYHKVRERLSSYFFPEF